MPALLVATAHQLPEPPAQVPSSLVTLSLKLEGYICSLDRTLAPWWATKLCWGPSNSTRSRSTCPDSYYALLMVSAQLHKCW